MILNLSCRVGASLVTLVGIGVSARTLLRTVDQSPRSIATSLVLGVDDFALRRGMSYATLLCDMETGRPIDVLMGRNSKELKHWLSTHPGVEIIVRDRASAYAQAASQGAPNAMQVADRFHLVRNVSDALREVVDRQAWALPVLIEMHIPVPDRMTQPVAKLPQRQAQRLAATAARRRDRYEEIKHRLSNCESCRSISHPMGLSRGTVAKYLRAQDVPERAPRRRLQTELDRHTEYLKKRWTAGCHNAAQLFRELQGYGYLGSPASV